MEDFGNLLKMLVAYVVNKMFGKNLDKQMKLVDKDVGFAEDSFELCKQATGDEAHCVGNFVIKQDDISFEKMNSARSRRTEIMNVIIESVNSDIKNQDWCRLKHLCTEAMHTQELMVRLSSIKSFELAKRCADIHKECYMEFLEILGFTEENLNSSTSA